MTKQETPPLPAGGTPVERPVGRLWIPAALSGRCANGHERGRGHVAHALPSRDGKDVAYYERSFCGKTHGARSAGWSPRLALQVTCPDCLRKMPPVRNREPTHDDA